MEPRRCGAGQLPAGPVLAGAEVIELIVPDGVAVSEQVGDPPGLVVHPGEADAVARAAPQRRAEYVTVRHCARLALAELGISPAAIGSGPDGEPLWPAGVIGSLTHCEEYRAAAVARLGSWLSIGIDVEPNRRLPDDVVELIALPAERAALARAPVRGNADVGRLLFSAKEAVYKAWYPLTRQWLDFDQVEVTVHGDESGPSPTQGQFSARFLVPGPVVSGRRLTTLSGRWLSTRRYVATALLIPG